MAIAKLPKQGYHLFIISIIMPIISLLLLPAVLVPHCPGDCTVQGIFSVIAIISIFLFPIVAWAIYKGKAWAFWVYNVLSYIIPLLIIIYSIQLFSRFYRNLVLISIIYAIGLLIFMLFNSYSKKCLSYLEQNKNS
jgi:hypothetical protein